jgi:hypothetical protein
MSGLSAVLVPWRAPMAVFDPGRMLVQLALSVAAGGDCLADIRGTRRSPADRRAGALDGHDIPTGRRVGGRRRPSGNCRPPSNSMRTPGSVVSGTPFGKRGSDDRVAVGRASDSGVYPSDRWAAIALPWRGAVSCSGRRGR